MAGLAEEGKVISVRLITPIDADNKGSTDTASTQSGTKYYQLTHDYLVRSLRDWLTRKQKETRRGRAELLLADRAIVWNARPENRQLPSLVQWLQIRFLTTKQTWNPAERKMMQRAGRLHLLHGVAVAAFLMMASFAGLAIRARTVETQMRTRAEGLVQAVLKADTAQVPAIISDMRDYRRWTEPLLRVAFDQALARVFRGGSFKDDASLVRSAYRNTMPPDQSYSYLGFRIARTLSTAQSTHQSRNSAK